MTNFFVRPWEISAVGETIELTLEGQKQIKTLQQLRQDLYTKIVDEAVFIARASEGAISVEWILDQPIAIRKKYVESFDEELKERKKQIEKMKKGRKR